MGWRPTSWMVATGVPVAVVVVGGWQRRWISDDGFINFRVIDQVLAGHGPVFNQASGSRSRPAPCGRCCSVCSTP